MAEKKGVNELELPKELKGLQESIAEMSKLVGDNTNVITGLVTEYYEVMDKFSILVDSLNNGEKITPAKLKALSKCIEESPERFNTLMKDYLK